MTETRESKRDRYHRHRKEGRCVRCSRPAESEKSRCEACRQKINKKQKLPQDRPCAVCGETMLGAGPIRKYCLACGKKVQREKSKATATIQWRETQRIRKERTQFLLDNPDELERLRKKIHSEAKPNV